MRAASIALLGPWRFAEYIPQLGVCFATERSDIPVWVCCRDLFQTTKPVSVFLDEDEAFEMWIDVKCAQHRPSKIDRLFPQGLTLEKATGGAINTAGPATRKRIYVPEFKRLLRCWLVLQSPRVEFEIVVDSIELDLGPSTSEPMPLI